MNEDDKEYIAELLKKEPDGWMKDYIENAKRFNEKQKGVYYPVPEIDSGPEPAVKNE